MRLEIEIVEKGKLAKDISEGCCAIDIWAVVPVED